MHDIPSDSQYKPRSCCLRNIFVFIIGLGLGGEKIQQPFITHQVEWKDVFIREVVQQEIEKFMFLLFLSLFDEGVTLTLLKLKLKATSLQLQNHISTTINHHHVFC